MATTPAQVPNLPESVYGVFCGGIDQATAQKFVNTLTVAMGGKVQHVHLLFQTAGGYIADGVFLYNFFRSIPIELTLYNVGQVSSIGVIAYLGAANRKVCKSATFMIHRSTNSAQFATATKLQHTAKSLILDDERTENIVRAHVNLPPKLWSKIKHHDVYFSGEEAIQFGLADGFAEFSPPAGSHVFNVLA
jgi:ATP-dependent Clp protease protease subunit